MPVAVSCCADPAAELLSGGLTEIDVSCGVVGAVLAPPDASKHPPSVPSTAMIARALIDRQANETGPRCLGRRNEAYGIPKKKLFGMLFIRN